MGRKLGHGAVHSGFVQGIQANGQGALAKFVGDGSCGLMKLAMLGSQCHGVKGGEQGGRVDVGMLGKLDQLVGELPKHPRLAKLFTPFGMRGAILGGLAGDALHALGNPQRGGSVFDRLKFCE